MNNPLEQVEAEARKTLREQIADGEVGFQYDFRNPETKEVHGGVTFKAYRQYPSNKWKIRIEMGNGTVMKNTARGTDTEIETLMWEMLWNVSVELSKGDA